MEIYIARSGNETGPYTKEQIDSLYEMGMLQLADFVWHEGMPDWMPLHGFLGMRPPVPAAGHQVGFPSNHLIGTAAYQGMVPAVSSVGSPENIVPRKFWNIWFLTGVTFGLYGLYLLPRQTWEIERITGRSRINVWLLLFLSIVTLSLFGMIYQIILAWKLQGISKEVNLAGRSGSLGVLVTISALVSCIMGFATGIPIIPAVLSAAIPLWLIQKEINLYLDGLRTG
ncbi:MAG: DUF4339 domain-containing protein [Akkermansiaceae bacterium]|nr:DUF4339 domain-containing protein [Akkermansiaceae bacterium]